MSLITDLSQSSEIKSAVANLYQTTGEGFSGLLAKWEHGMDVLWGSDSAAKLAEMGTNARGMVSTHTACVAFLESFSPGCTAERGAAMPAYTLHEDGTVTLD